MNIVIVDDEKISCMQLQALIRGYATEHNVEIATSYYTDPQAFIREFQPGRYTIVFLDIYMGDVTGIEVAEAIRAKEPEVMIIFCTTSVDNMPQAFTLHAFDYIVKPPKPDRINQLLSDATRVLPEVEHYVTISVNRQKYTLKRSDITSITTQGHYLIITNVDDEEFQSRNTLVQFMDELEQDERFLAINKGVVINMDYIDRIEDGVCILTDGQQFPVKIRELSQISQKIQDYRSHK